jgi:hypothetical protein
MGDFLKFDAFPGDGRAQDHVETLRTKLPNLRQMLLHKLLDSEWLLALL